MTPHEVEKLMEHDSECASVRFCLGYSHPHLAAYVHHCDCDRDARIREALLGKAALPRQDSARFDAAMMDLAAGIVGFVLENKDGDPDGLAAGVFSTVEDFAMTVLNKERGASRQNDQALPEEETIARALSVVDGYGARLDQVSDKRAARYREEAKYLRNALDTLSGQPSLPSGEQKALPEITAERLFEMLPSDVFGVANITSKQARAVCKVLAEKLTTLLSGNSSLSSPSAGLKEEPINWKRCPCGAEWSQPTPKCLVCGKVFDAAERSAGERQDG